MGSDIVAQKKEARMTGGGEVLNTSPGTMASEHGPYRMAKWRWQGSQGGGVEGPLRFPYGCKYTGTYK